MSSVIGEDSATGTALDYFKGVCGVQFAVTLELRGGNSGFVIDNSHIQVSFEEIWNGLTTHIEAIEMRKLTSEAVSVSMNSLVIAVVVSFFAKSHVLSDTFL